MYIRILTIHIVILLLVGTALGQSAEVDSLLKELKTARKDTNKVNLLLELSLKAGLWESHADSAMLFAKQAEQLAMEINYPKGLAEAYSKFARVKEMKGDFKEGMQWNEAALKIVMGINDRSWTADLYDNIGVDYYYLGDYEAVFQNFNRALELRKSLNDEKGVGDSYNNIGNVYLSLGKYPEAMVNYGASLKIKEKFNDEKGITNTYSNLGVCYYEMGNHAEALKYHLLSLKGMENRNDKKGMAGAYLNIAGLYHSLDKLDLALSNYETAFKLSEELGDKYLIGRAYSGFGMVYAKLKDYDKALETHFKALEIKTGIGDKKGIGTTHQNIGNVYFLKKEFDKAIEYYTAAVNIATELDDKASTAFSLIETGRVFMSKKDYKTARQNIVKALSISTAIGTKDHSMAGYELLARVDSAQGDFRNAFENHKLYIAFRDSMFNEENTQKLTQLEMQSAFDKEKALEQAEQEKKDALTAEQLLRKDRERNGVMAGLALALVFAGFLYNRFRLTRKQKRVIEKQKEEVETKNAEILQSIAYARRLQDAVLPPARIVKEFFADSFLLYLPKDIVSGDFYWMENRGSVSYFAVGDCTGHGVPGAMLSVIGLNGLNRCLNEMHITSPAAILERLTLIFQSSFERSEATVRDGMDIGICALDNTTGTLTFAGANTMLRIVRNGEIIEYKGDKRAVGFHDTAVRFSEVKISLEKGDTLILCTDGFADQFGGPEGKKFLNKRLRELLVSLSDRPMPDQRTALLEAFEAWRGDAEQTDDVCVMGVRV